MYGEILAELKVPPSELWRKVDYHRERARVLSAQAETMRTLADASRALASSLDYEDTARRVARIPVTWLVPTALLYLAEPLPGDPPVQFLFAHRDPDREHC